MNLDKTVNIYENENKLEQENETDCRFKIGPLNLLN